MYSIVPELLAYVTVRVAARPTPPAGAAAAPPFGRRTLLSTAATATGPTRVLEPLEGRYAAAVTGWRDAPPDLGTDTAPSGVHFVRAWGPLGPTEGLGVRAVKAILDGNVRPSAEMEGVAARLDALLALREASIVPVPQVVRVRVGIMGDALADEVDAHRFAVAWTDAIAAALGVDEVCLACTVNLRGSPAKDHCTTYWTADGAAHDRRDPEDETFLAITQVCWDAALEAVRSA